MDVLYQDDWLLAVNKPSGLLTHRGWANDRVTALSLAREIAGRYVYPVHRLDRATSGVLLFALDPETAATMRTQIDAGGLDKLYVALVRGLLAQSVDVDYPLAAEDDPERKPARTLVQPLGSFERYTLVQAKPLTGRTHQIRRHLKHLRHPVIGDTRYGDGAHNRVFRTRFGLHRLALHAVRLALTHPKSGELLCLRAQLPDDLGKPLEAMGLLATASEPPLTRSP